MDANHATQLAKADSGVNFNYIFQGYFIGSGAIIR